jgi:hypothetical protein
MSTHEPAVTVRLSLAEEGGDVARLAALDGAAAPSGLVAIADLDGEPVAAVGIAEGDAVADPKRSTASILALLHLHRLAVRVVVGVWGA